MFRWGQSSPSGYAFSRIDPESGDVHLLLSTDDAPPAPRTKGSGRYLMPALYERTDGIWRMAYEKNGEVMLEAWRGKEVIDAPFALCRGTSPRWNFSGSALLIARARGGGKLGAYDIVARVLPDKETQLSTSEVVRSPSWSPDERFAAFFAKDAGENKPWRIEVAALAGGKARALVQDVVVNAGFESDEPTWEPSSRRVWCFSNQHKQQTYYPLVAADVEGGQQHVIDYPQRCTNPGDLAINPKTIVPELVFVGHEGLPQDVYVLFLNHY
jgi:Tol biopolymer transport system component